MEKKRIYNFDEAFEASLKYFDGDQLAARVWVNKYAMKDSLGNIYENSPEQMHWRLANEIARIEKKYPNYLSTFDNVMKKKDYCICNMCVISKKKFDNYCKWLFDILFELEKITDLSEYSPLQKRIYGFLSERLFNVWIAHNNLNVKPVNMICLESDNLKTIVKKATKRILHKKS